MMKSAVFLNDRQFLAGYVEEIAREGGGLRAIVKRPVKAGR
jgi:hypothetical protein